MAERRHEIVDDFPGGRRWRVRQAFSQQQFGSVAQIMGRLQETAAIGRYAGSFAERHIETIDQKPHAKIGRKAAAQMKCMTSRL
ncbi:hypothetical protein SBA_ch1_36060 [Sphingomonas bisphenolicum]|uniref:Uncharacterized protein n=2 Tax=Sphingomonas bisphenolicum TaxID=296544 RepID=A0ABN5WGH4_9SPHN|nr:hypothetical protein SBA_ch1_36060 [Sphingomonas bisphenolicum]